MLRRLLADVLPRRGVPYRRRRCPDGPVRHLRRAAAAAAGILDIAGAIQLLEPHPPDCRRRPRPGERVLGGGTGRKAVPHPLDADGLARLTPRYAGPGPKPRCPAAPTPGPHLTMWDKSGRPVDGHYTG